MENRKAVLYPGVDFDESPYVSLLNTSINSSEPISFSHYGGNSFFPLPDLPNRIENTGKKKKMQKINDNIKEPSVPQPRINEEQQQKPQLSFRCCIRVQEDNNSPEKYLSPSSSSTNNSSLRWVEKCSFFEIFWMKKNKSLFCLKSIIDENNNNNNNNLFVCVEEKEEENNDPQQQQEKKKTFRLCLKRVPEDDPISLHHIFTITKDPEAFIDGKTMIQSVYCSHFLNYEYSCSSSMFLNEEKGSSIYFNIIPFVKNSQNEEKQYPVVQIKSNKFQRFLIAEKEKFVGGVSIRCKATLKLTHHLDDRNDPRINKMIMNTFFRVFPLEEQPYFFLYTSFGTHLKCDDEGIINETIENANELPSKIEFLWIDNNNKKKTTTTIITKKEDGKKKKSSSCQPIFVVKERDVGFLQVNSDPSTGEIGMKSSRIGKWEYFTLYFNRTK